MGEGICVNAKSNFVTQPDAMLMLLFSFKSHKISVGGIVKKLSKISNNVRILKLKILLEVVTYCIEVVRCTLQKN